MDEMKRLVLIELLKEMREKYLDNADNAIEDRKASCVVDCCDYLLEVLNESK